MGDIIPAGSPRQGQLPEEYRTAAIQQLADRIHAVKQTLSECVVVLCGVCCMVETANILAGPPQWVILPNLAESSPSPPTPRRYSRGPSSVASGCSSSPTSTWGATPRRRWAFRSNTCRCRTRASRWAATATSRWRMPASSSAMARLVARDPGVFSGGAVFSAAMMRTHASIRVSGLIEDGVSFETGAVLAEVTGPARAVLQAERVGLNFVQRVCGIAPLTAGYVAETTGTGARIVDTRKTTPGLRATERHAVCCGGGSSVSRSPSRSRNRPALAALSASPRLATPSSETCSRWSRPRASPARRSPGWRATPPSRSRSRAMSR